MVEYLVDTEEEREVQRLSKPPIYTMEDTLEDVVDPKLLERFPLITGNPWEPKEGEVPIDDIEGFLTQVLRFYHHLKRDQTTGAYAVTHEELPVSVNFGFPFSIARVTVSGNVPTELLTIERRLQGYGFPSATDEQFIPQKDGSEVYVRTSDFEVDTRMPELGQVLSACNVPYDASGPHTGFHPRIKPYRP